MNHALGEQAAIVFDDGENGPQLTLRWRGETERLTFDPTQPLRAEMDMFVRCVRTNSKPKTDFSEGLEVVKLLDRAQKLASETTDRPFAFVAR